MLRVKAAPGGIRRGFGINECAVEVEDHRFVGGFFGRSIVVRPASHKSDYNANLPPDNFSGVGLIVPRLCPKQE